MNRRLKLFSPTLLHLFSFSRGLHHNHLLLHSTTSSLYSSIRLKMTKEGIITPVNQSLAGTAVASVNKEGSFVRKESKHRYKISNKVYEVNDNTTISYPPEKDRYHLHIALACPWAAGVLSMLYLKGLEHVISHSVVHPTWGKTKPDNHDDAHYGWLYLTPNSDDQIQSPHGPLTYDDALIPDSVTNAKSIREVYELCGDFDGPYTTPILFDKVSKTIVNNESSEILRMLNDQFNDFAKFPEVNLYPTHLQEELQLLNDSMIYPKINNGVYRCGFAQSQQAYDTAVTELFTSLDYCEDYLSTHRYLGSRHDDSSNSSGNNNNNTLTWLDLRLFHTLIRFDPVYITYFKTNLKRISDYPNLLGFVRDVYSMEPIRRSINMSHIKMHYFTSHPKLNPYGIIPIYDGPDLDVPHGRENIS